MSRAPKSAAVADLAAQFAAWRAFCRLLERGLLLAYKAAAWDELYVSPATPATSAESQAAVAELLEEVGT